MLRPYRYFWFTRGENCCKPINYITQIYLVVGGWVLVVGGWWLVVGGWWLVVAGCWLMVAG